MFGEPTLFSGVAQAATGVESSWCVSFAGAGSVSFTSQNLGTTHTIQAWVYHSGTSGVVVGGASGHRGLYVDATYITYTAGGTSVAVAHGGIANAWKHVAVVRSGTSVSFYLNGSPAGSTQTLAANNSLSIQYLGRDAAGAYLTGRVDDVRVHTTALSSGSVASTANNTSPATADVLLFGLEEGTGNTVDSVQSLTGTLASATWHPQTPPKLVSGRETTAYSLSLDGSSDCMQVASSAACNLTNNFSISVWAKSSAWGSNSGIFTRMTTTNGYGLVSNSVDTKLAFIRFSGGSFHYLTSDTILPTNQWVHLAGVVESGVSRTYVNGIRQSATGSQSIGSAPTVTLSCGRFYGDIAALFFGGKESFARIDAVALSDADVQQLARGQNPTVAVPVGFWKLNEGSGTTAIDYGSGGNNGTLTNGPTYSTDVPPWLSA